MSFSFKIFRSAAARAALLFCVGISGLANLQSHGRPIEFSEPTGTNLTANVSELGAKPAKLPAAEQSVFGSHSFNTPIDTPSNMRPLAPLPGSAAPRNIRRDREKNWMLMTPDEMMQSLITRDVNKQQRFGTSAYGLEQAASRDRYAPQTSRQNSRTNQLGAYDFRGLSSETNRWDNASGTFTLNDPFAAYAGKRPSHGSQQGSDLNADRPYSLSDLLKSGDDISSDAVGGRKALADHMEEFKKPLDAQTPGANRGLLNPAPGNGSFGNSRDPLPGSSYSSVPEKTKSVLTPPGVRLAPTAPLAPDQISLTPSPNPAPSKPKSVLPSSPQRKF